MQTNVTNAEEVLPTWSRCSAVMCHAAEQLLLPSGNAQNAPLSTGLLLAVGRSLPKNVPNKRIRAAHSEETADVDQPAKADTDVSRCEPFF